MESSSDEDDKFLYGSDSETLSGATSSTQSKKRNVSQVSGETGVKRPRLSPVGGFGDEGGNDNGSDNDNLDYSDEARNGDGDNDVNDSDNSYGDSDSDNDNDSGSESDSDVDFIISMGPDTTRLDMETLTSSATASAGSSAISQQQQQQQQFSTIRVATESVSPGGKTTGDTSLSKDGTTGATTTATSTLTSTSTLAEGTANTTTEFDMNGAVGNASGSGSIDLDKDGLFDGQPITQLDPEVLKEKPWRQPGANLADYFNYGFNEYTWMEYLNRQEKLRQEFNPRRIFMGLLNLQQQGKLDPQQPMPNNSNEFGMNKQLQNKIPSDGGMKNTSHAMLQPPPTFPSIPMFGGFPPFPMSGMMPMNPQPKKQQQQQQQR